MLHHTSYVCIPRMCVYALCIDDDDFSISDCRRSNGAWEQCTKCWKKDRNKKRGQMNKWEIYHQSGTLAVENILQENVCSRKIVLGGLIGGEMPVIWKIASWTFWGMTYDCFLVFLLSFFLCVDGMRDLSYLDVLESSKEHSHRKLWCVECIGELVVCCFVKQRHLYAM